MSIGSYLTVEQQIEKYQSLHRLETGPMKNIYEDYLKYYQNLDEVGCRYIVVCSENRSYYIPKTWCLVDVRDGFWLDGKYRFAQTLSAQEMFLPASQIKIILKYPLDE